MTTTNAVSLGDLHARNVGDRLVGNPTVLLYGVQHDSRRVGEGDLFVAIQGERHDGASYAQDAVDNGAVAVLAERELRVDVPLMISQDVRRDLGRAAEIIYGQPTSALSTIGITGTNGKTTVAYLLEDVIAGAGGVPALIGTTGCRLNGETKPGLHTTPEGDDISRFALQAVQAGCTHLVMEVSSHGLSLHRVDAVDFTVAAFTNLSQDHLDFHETIEDYGKAKARLFTDLNVPNAVFNIDDRFGAKLSSRFLGTQLRCSARPDAEAEVRVLSSDFTRDGIVASFGTPAGKVDVQSPLVGRHNLENLAVTIGCAHALGFPMDHVAAALKCAEGSPGRLERIVHEGNFDVFVDYAHTPDALQRVLQALRPLTPARLIVVFGAGGARDKTKRPRMGEQAVRCADIVVITSDNPRTEDPMAIVESIEAGARAAGAKAIDEGDLGRSQSGVVRIVDRRAAIEAAINAASDGDVVLLAGKGHETVQIIGDRALPFDDREQARLTIARREGRA